MVEIDILAFNFLLVKSFGDDGFSAPSRGHVKNRYQHANKMLA